MTELTEEQKKELKKLAFEASIEAKMVVEDYKKTPSDVSVSVTHIHIDSPLLEEENDK